MSFAFARVIAGLSLAATMSLFAVGCASEVEGSDPSSTASSSKITLTGNVGGGSTGTGTRTFGSVSTSSGSLHVSARELHVQGASGRTVDVAVAGDGSFRLDVARGARWVVTVDDGDGKSALVTFGNGNSALSVKASSSDNGGGGSASVDVGSIHIVGGEAHSDVTFDGTAYGLEATIANLDEVFEAADGAIIKAHEALELAKKATEAALKAAASAEEAASEAEKAAAAAEAAAKAAQGKR